MADQKLQDLSVEELNSELATLQADLNRTSFEHSVRGLQNTNVLKETRKEIARVKTELRKRELAAMPEEALAMRSKIRARRARNK
jgi:large subunit ribosomal protein L29